MKHKIATILFSAVFAFVASGIAFAEDEMHIEKALEHSSMAMEEGNAGNAEALVEHTKEVLRHAHMAEQAAQRHVEHIEAAIVHLHEALQHAKMGHTKMGTHHLKEAIRLLHAATGKGGYGGHGGHGGWHHKHGEYGEYGEHGEY